LSTAPGNGASREPSASRLRAAQSIRWRNCHRWGDRDPLALLLGLFEPPHALATRELLLPCRRLASAMPPSTPVPNRHHPSTATLSSRSRLRATSESFITAKASPQLSFSSAVKDRYQINMAQYDRSGRMNYTGRLTPSRTLLASIGRRTSAERSKSWWRLCQTSAAQLFQSALARP
jgi:hypothetical protein